MNIKINNKVFWLIPVLMVLVLSLAITLNNKWPLSWDIYIHINYALTYINHGITTIDPLLNAPNGKEIGYVPLFHMLLILVSKISGLNLVSSAKLFQIIMPMISILSVMGISYKLYDEISALASGLLLISSFMFSRLYLPIPESVAIVLFLVGIYLYYLAITLKNRNYAILSGFMALLILSVHFSSSIYYMILLTLLMITQSIIQRSFDVLKYYLYALGTIVLIGIVAVMFLLLISPSHISQLLSGVLSVVSDPMTLFMGQKAMGIERYIKCVGILPLIFGIIGIYYSFKNKELLFISTWTLIAFILSNLHWFGIPVYTYRMLIYLVLPGVIIGGYGIAKIVNYLNSKRKIYSIILIGLLVILSFSAGYSQIKDPSVLTSSASTEESTYQIAPPTQEELEVISWFENVNNTDKSILSNNLFFATIVSSVDEIPIHYKFDSFINSSSEKSINKEKIGYILYDKSLVLNNSTEYSTLDVVCINGSFYPTYYFTQEITSSNFENIKLPSTEKVFENSRFIICKVNE